MTLSQVNKPGTVDSLSARYIFLKCEHMRCYMTRAITVCGSSRSRYYVTFAYGPFLQSVVHNIHSWWRITQPFSVGYFGTHPNLNQPGPPPSSPSQSNVVSHP